MSEPVRAPVKLFAGADGGVVWPPVPCVAGSGPVSENDVGKLLKAGSDRQARREQRIVNRVDPEHRFTVPARGCMARPDPELAAECGLGLAAATVLVEVVNPQSFHWSMDMNIPWLRLVSLALAVITAGTVTAQLAGRAAATRDAVLAVKEDW